MSRPFDAPPPGAPLSGALPLDEGEARYRDGFVAAALVLGEREPGALLPEGASLPAWAVTGETAARARALAAQILRLRVAVDEATAAWR